VLREREVEVGAVQELMMTKTMMVIIID